AGRGADRRVAGVEDSVVVGVADDRGTERRVIDHAIRIHDLLAGAAGVAGDGRTARAAPPVVLGVEAPRTAAVAAGVHLEAVAGIARDIVVVDRDTRAGTEGHVEVGADGVASSVGHRVAGHGQAV